MRADDRKRVCIVGGGLAGGIVAARMAAAGHRVTLIEQGMTPAPLMPTDETWEGDGLKSAFTRGEGLGGSSNFWHGGLIALDASDIEAPGCPGGSPKYPISYARLCGYYRQALHLLSDAEISMDDLTAADGEGVSVAIDQALFEPKVLIFPSKPFSTKSLLENAQRRDGLEIVTMTADTLLFDGESRATAVQGIAHPSGQSTTVAADLFVLCAGGIGSVKVLLNAAAVNPALAKLPIGRNITDHPTGFVFKAKLKARRNLKRMFGSAYGKTGHFRRRLGIKLKDDSLGIAAHRNHALYLRPAFSMRNPRDYNVLKNRLVWHRGAKITLWEKLQLFRYLDLLMEALNFRFGVFPSVRYIAGFVFAEQFPAETNCIVRDADGRFTIHWRISKPDTASLEGFLGAFLHSQKDLVEEFVLFSDLLDSGAHHSGGCRIASTPTDGVVDEDLRVFGTTNLFVADGSVLAYTGHANTGLTIAAFALMCVDSLQRELTADRLPTRVS
ncbi:MAG: oxidoreductase [Gemmatimonadetes bacterium]|nr:oxidoreductase [Gemmatimonadota bacterium]